MYPSMMSLFTDAHSVIELYEKTLVGLPEWWGIVTIGTLKLWVPSRRAMVDYDEREHDVIRHKRK